MCKELVESIKDTEVLKGLNEEQLLRFAESCEVKSYGAEDVIIQTGESTRDLYILIKGSCIIEVDVDKYLQDSIMRVLNPGDTFGELSFLDRTPRSAAVVCKKDCKVATISARKFDKLINESPELGIIVLKNIALILTGRIRKTHRSFKNTYGKIR